MNAVGGDRLLRHGSLVKNRLGNYAVTSTDDRLAEDQGCWSRTTARWGLDRSTRVERVNLPTFPRPL